MGNVEKQEIMASINCVTYNHAGYIRKALDSFLMQETDFQFEILVHDDASTDGTSDIIREYAKRFPDRIFPLALGKLKAPLMLSIPWEYWFSS